MPRKDRRILGPDLVGNQVRREVAQFITGFCGHRQKRSSPSSVIGHCR
jgi:hypothetical protein